MTTFRENTAQPTPTRKLKLAEILEIFAAGKLPLKFSAYDGSTAGPDDAELGLSLLTPRGTTYLATAPEIWGWPVPTSPATSNSTVCTRGIPTSCSRRWQRRWTSGGHRRAC